MKKRFLHRLGFAGKSLLWSALFYVVLMASINWDDVSSGFKKYRDEALAGNIVSTTTPNQTVTDTPPSKNDNGHKHSTVFAAVKTVVDLIGKIADLNAR